LETTVNVVLLAIVIPIWYQCQCAY
jgi:hypothetical protein